MDEATGIEFPFYQGQMYDIFGEPSPGASLLNITCAPWISANLQTSFAHVVDYEGNPWSYRIYGNAYDRGPLAPGFRLSSWSGGWPRNSRRGTAVSISGR